MKIVDEFREFISKGNVMDMAVGVIIGGAFTSIVGSLTDDIINPFITFVTGGNGTEIGGLVVPGTTIDFGAFLSAVINFFIVSLIVFALVKSLNKIKDAAAALTKKKEEEAEAAAPTCPFCLEEVKEGATRCPHCAAAFDSPAVPK